MASTDAAQRRAGALTQRGEPVRWVAAFGAATAVIVYLVPLGTGLGFAPDNDAAEAAFVFAFLLYALVGALVAWHRPSNPIGWLLLGMGTVVVLSAALDAYSLAALVTDPGSLPGGVWARWAENWLYALAWSIGTTLPLFLLPDGRVPSPRWRPVVVVAVLVAALVGPVEALRPGPIGEDVPIDNPVGLDALAGPLDLLGLVLFSGTTVLTLLGLAALVIRWRGASGQVRRQLAYVVFAVVVALGLLGLVLVLDSLGVPEVAAAGIVALALALPPCGIAVAILRDQMFDIEIVLSRTIIYAAISVVIVATYAACLALSSRWFSERADVAASLLATGVVAIGLGSVKDRLERRAERLLFGARREPYAVLAGLGATLHQLPEQADVLTALADWVREALRLPYVAVELDGSARAAVSGEVVAHVQRWPMTYQGRELGQLVAGRRTAADAFTAGELVLLEDAARQMAVAARSMQLSHDLQTSREHLVRAREHERVRFRRDLHDGLGPVLASAALQVDSLRGHLAADDTDGEAIALRVKEELRRAVTDIRELIDGLRPATLDQLGLATAIEEHLVAVRDAGISVGIDVNGDLRDVGPAAELAAYRIVIEALTNVVRHAEADSAQVRVDRTDHHIALSVTDDGRGLPKQLVVGVGLDSMRERAAELGGWLTIADGADHGVVVRARIPVEAP